MMNENWTVERIKRELPDVMLQKERFPCGYSTESRIP